MKIVVFTGDENNGGIQQLVFSVVRALRILNHEVVLFMPDMEQIQIAEDLESGLVRYGKVDSIFPSTKQIERIATQINETNSDLLFIPEDCIISMQVLAYVSKKTKKLFMIHDVKPHPNRQNLRRRLVSILSAFYRRYGLKYTDHVCLLSENSLRLFNQCFPAYSDKAILCKLGAHPPIAKSNIPVEIAEFANEKYILFFGRIDKYKGIENLLRAYSFAQTKETVPKLIIAGNGEFSEVEKQLISDISNVICLNRFIENGEMIWLFEHCLYVTVPYIEASQSGVIPLAYYYGKPVIASNIEGLKENVEDGSTGYLISNIEEMTQKIILMKNTKMCNDFNSACYAFYSSNMCWEHNIEQLLYEVGRA